MFKVNNKNVRKTSSSRSGVFIATLEHISQIFIVSIVAFGQVNISWVVTKLFLTNVPFLSPI